MICPLHILGTFCLVLVFMPGVKLSLTRINETQVTLSWHYPPNVWGLRYSPRLDATVWNSVDAPEIIFDGWHQVTVDLSSDMRFFRLCHRGHPSVPAAGGSWQAFQWTDNNNNQVLH